MTARPLFIPAAILILTVSACGKRDSNPRQTGPTISASLVTTIQLGGIPRHLAFSPDSETLATSNVDGTVKLWSVPAGAPLRTLKHPAGVTSVAFSPDGSMLVTGSYDGGVRLWRVADGTMLRGISGHAAAVWTVAWSPDGRFIASGGEDREAKLWRGHDLAPVGRLRGHSLNLWSVSFSADSRMLATGSFDRTIKVWSVPAGTLLRTLRAHEQAVVSVAFGPRNALLASGGDDSTVRLWLADQGRLVRTSDASNHVYALAFSSDGRWIASGGRERGALGTLRRQIFGRPAGERRPSVILWRVRDGSAQLRLAAHDGDVRSVAFSPDSRYLASSGDDGTARLFLLGVPP